MNHSTQCFASTCSPKMQHRIDRRVWLILGVLQALCQVAVADESRSLVVQTTPAHSPYLLEWTGNDELIVTKSRGGEIRVWRTDSGNLVQSLPSAGPKDGFAVSDDGAFVAAISEARVSVAERHSRRVAWQSPETEIIRSLTGLVPPHLMICDGTEVRRINYVNNVVTHRWKVGQNEGIRQICGLRNGHTVAFLEGRGVVIMDTDLKEVGSIPSDRSKSLYYGLASRDGKALALAAFDGTWIGSTDQLGAGWSRAAKSPGASGVALSSKGDRLAFGTFGRSLVVQSPPGADGIAEWPTIRTIDKMAWNRADTKLALVTQRNGVVIVDAKSGEELRFFGVPVPAGAIKFDARATWLGWRLKSGTFVRASIVTGEVGFIALETKLAVSGAVKPPHDDETFLLSDARHVHLYTLKGRLVDKASAQGNSFSSGSWGSDGIYFRNNTSMDLFKQDGKALKSAGGFPMEITRRCVFSADGRAVLHQPPGDEKSLVLRLGPDWSIAATIPVEAHSEPPSACWLADDAKTIAWIDDHQTIIRFNIAESTTSIIRPADRRNAFNPFKTFPAEPRWFIGRKPGYIPFSYVILSANDGTTVYESKAWTTFADEVDLEPIGLTANRRGLWLCGPGARPLLVDLSTGQPVLRLHVFGDSEYVWETAGGEVHGTETCKSRCLFADADGMNVHPNSERLAVIWNEKAISMLLRRFND